MNRSVYIYWVGKEYSLIPILRKLMYFHSTNGIGYTLHLITHQNLYEYVKELPPYFYNMQPAHQADYIRINVITEKGGIWLDSDIIVRNSLDSLFDLIEHKDGFFMNENNSYLYNGVFGSKPNTKLMIKWREESRKRLDAKNGKIDWAEIGNLLLHEFYKNDRTLFENYKIFEGLDNLYPVNFPECVEEYVNKPYDNYRNILRSYQPLIVIVSSVYLALENFTSEQILNSDIPLAYFIRDSISNAKLVDYDFIEIGTSNFDTFIQTATDEKGLSVEPVKYYLNCLPDKSNVKKINVAISNSNYKTKIYYIPEDVIKNNNLPDWFKGCNKIGDYHPLHIQHNLQHLCVQEDVDVISISELFYRNRVKCVNFLKIDTEGYDCVILNALHDHLKYLPDTFYPAKILFESNEHTSNLEVNKTIANFRSLGYKLLSKDYNTILIYQKN